MLEKCIILLNIPKRSVENVDNTVLNTVKGNTIYDFFFGFSKNLWVL